MKVAVLQVADPPKRPSSFVATDVFDPCDAAKWPFGTEKF